MLPPKDINDKEFYVCFGISFDLLQNFDNVFFVIQLALCCIREFPCAAVAALFRAV